MRRASLVTPARIALGIVCGAAFATGCGDEDDSANEPRPPAPIVVTASISNDEVSVSPRTFGAGPVSLVITNQTDASQEVRLETDEVGGTRPGIQQETGPINPADTAQLRADVREGTYRVSVSSDAIEPATLRVGPERESAQNDLLQP
jgi:hypothetical protein